MAKVGRSAFSDAVQAFRRGDLLAAETLCTVVLDEVRSVQALHLLSVVHLQTGRAGSALQLVNDALRSRPDEAELLTLRGNILRATGMPAEALLDFDRAVALAPRAAPVWTNRGLALAAFGRHREALESHRRAVELDGRLAEAHNNLGNTLLMLRRPQEALESYVRAVALNNSFLLPRVNICEALLALLRPDEALAAAQDVLKRIPAERKALVHQVSALRSLGRREDALQAAESACAALPQDADLRSLLGDIQLANKQYPEARASYERLMQLAPEHNFSIGRLCEASLLGCDWEHLDDITRRVLRQIPEGRPVIAPFGCVALPSSPSLQLDCARAFMAHTQVALLETLPPAPRLRGPRLRIAYLSPDFRAHPVAHQIAGLLEAHNRSSLEVIGVALARNDDSEVAARIRRACDVFIEAADLTDDELIAQLREIAPDVAIDLCGHTAGARFGLFARRVAPVQVNFLGYPGTMGTTFHDYIIADEHVIPADEERHYSEQVIRLPESYQPYDPQPISRLARGQRGAAGLPPEGFVFCCFNNHFKIAPPLFDVWMKILDAVPQSVLWLAKGPVSVMDNLRRSAQTRGIDVARLVFAEREDRREDHIARYALADLFLDTVPFNAHATASDALWAGLPVLTCRGSAFAGRVAAGMLHAVRLPELVATDLQHYAAMAVRLATKPVELAGLRQRLEHDTHSLPLFDLGRYCRDFEAAIARVC